MNKRSFLLALGLASCSPAQEPQAKKEQPDSGPRNVILFIGDSLSAGYGVAGEDAFPALLAKRWEREGLPTRARNAAVSGSTTAGALENLDWILAQDVHAAFICIGANDGLRGLDLEASRKNLAAIIEKVQSRGIEVVLAGMKLPPNYGKPYARRFEAIYPKLARRYRIKFMRFLLEGVAGDPKMNLQDGIHPNESGHRRIAENVHNFLKKKDFLK